jgi:hypothetical protein
MRKFTHYTAALMLLIIFFTTPGVFGQGLFKEMSVGYVRWKIVDSADEGEGSWGWGEHRAYYDGYDLGLVSSKAFMMASTNWTDEEGTVWPIKASGHGQWETNDRQIIMPVPDAAQWTIHKYLRYTPPTLIVDGSYVSDPFPLNGSDHVDPGRLPGTSDGLIESFNNTDMGVSFRQRIIGFSQKNHNKYIIREHVFINTGNTDLDPEIELPGQTVTGFYFLKQLRPQEWPTRPWVSMVGQYPGDPIRMMYAYSSREVTRETGQNQDDFGATDVNFEDYGDVWTGKMKQPFFWGEQVVFASESPANFNTDDVNQPHATSFVDVDFPSFTFHTRNMTTTQRENLYEVMENGAKNIEGILWPELAGTKPGTHHGVPLDQRGFRSITEMESFGYSASGAYSIGPYNLAFGDSIKIVIAECYGSISALKSIEVGKAWEANAATWGDNTPGGATEKLPQQYEDHPDLYESDDGKSTVNNWAKDNWVYSGFDSLMETAKAAKWAYENNLNVPQAPRAPSFEVKSLPEGIRIAWGSESEVDDFAGYRVYRAVGDFFPNIPVGSQNPIGVWEEIFACGEGTNNALTNEYLDANAQPQVSYYYAVTAFDDGSGNGPDYHGRSESLESTYIQNYTTQGASLLGEAGTLDEIVIAPNPYNLSAVDKNFPGEPNKLVFFNVPSKCTIRIFTETGDLVKVIEHEGGGSVPWGKIPQDQLATDIGQIVVSGVYIAHIETPDGNSSIRKFVVVR